VCIQWGKINCKSIVTCIKIATSFSFGVFALQRQHIDLLLIGQSYLWLNDYITYSRIYNQFGLKSKSHVLVDWFLKLYNSLLKPVWALQQKFAIPSVWILKEALKRMTCFATIKFHFGSLHCIHTERFFLIFLCL